MKIKQLLKEIDPILKAYKLRPNRKKEFDQARKINNHIESKVGNLLYLAGI